MRLILKLLIPTTILLLICTSSARPQWGIRYAGVDSSTVLVDVFALLGAKAVQEELKLDDGQKAKIAKLPEEVRGHFKKEREPLELTATETAAATAKVRAAVEKELDAALAKQLTAKQIDRLEQFVIQLLGVDAFSTPEVVEALQLTDKQKGEVRAIQEIWEVDNWLLRISPSAGEKRPSGSTASPVPDRIREAREAREKKEKEFREKIAPLETEALAKLVGLLDDNQKAVWKKLTGEKWAALPLGPLPHDPISEGLHNNRGLAYLRSYSTRRFAMKLHLLLTPELVKEFNLNNEAAEELLELPTRMTKHNSNLLAPVRKEEEAQKTLQVLEDRMAEEAVRRLRTDVLRPEQAKRLSQVERQCKGLFVFHESEVLRALQLTPEQAKALPEAGTKAFQKRPVSPFSNEYAACTAKGLAAVVALLDAAQKKTWAELYGEPFDFSKVIDFEPFRFIWIKRHGHCWFLTAPVDAWMEEAWSRQGKKDYAAVLSALDEVIRLTPKDPNSLQKKAYFLATCPDAKVRDGRKAVELAKKALEFNPDEYVISVYLATLACAYAEVGDFDKAVQSMTQALAKQHTTENNDAYKLRLKLFRAQQPFHEEPPK